MYLAPHAPGVPESSQDIDVGEPLLGLASGHAIADRDR